MKKRLVNFEMENPAANQQGAALHEGESSIRIEEISGKDIAIIGMSGSFGMADSIDEFWHYLVQGMNLITEYPMQRKADTNRYLRFLDTRQGEVRYAKMAFMKEIDKFDCNFFRISPAEASLMDPNQRLFLQTAWGAIEDAGYGGKRLSGTRTGVYVGLAGETLYKNAILQVEPASAAVSLAGNLESFIAARIAYILDLKGPSMLINTACSSSLVALHTACQALRNGDCDYAILGSTSISLVPLEDIPQFGVESSDAMTRTFDDSSDGTGCGEGVGAVLLKPYSRAARDGDHIYAVIKGTAINQDGSSMGITVPNSAAQEDVLARAWEDGGVDPETITCLEAHGSGTRLGDPIEIDGIRRAFARYTARKQFCAVGTVKTNIGHLGCAAGLAGLIKAVLSLKHKIIPPTLNFRKPNTKIDFKRSPVYVNDRLVDWSEEAYPRRCGVSSFGLSGTNCHIVLEEAPLNRQTEQEAGNGLQIFTVSAKSGASLRGIVERYRAFFRECVPYRTIDVCYTANTGRGHYQLRAAVIVKDNRELAEKLGILAACLEQDTWEKAAVGGIFYGTHNLVSRLKENRQEWEITDQDKDALNSQAAAEMQRLDSGEQEPAGILKTLCMLYTQGADLQWEKMYGKEKRHKVSLPSYFFERTRCWLAVPGAPGQSASRRKSAVDNKEWEQEALLSVKLSRTRIKGRENAGYSREENLLVQVIGKVLGYDELDIFDNFYELGGDSIIAMKVINLMNRTTGKSIKVTDMLRHPTIAEFAGYLQDRRNVQERDESYYPHIEPAGDREYYPVSSAQKRLYVLNRQLNGNDTCYNMTQIVNIEGSLDRERCAAAFGALVKRHEAFRTSFAFIADEPVQKINKDVDFQLEYMESGEFDLREIVSRFIKPFDLGKAPILRICLVRVSDQKSILMFDTHHIVADGITINILIDEFFSLYRGEKPEELKVQYKDFAVWQNKYMQSGFMQKQEAYWLNTFSGNIPSLNLPLDYPRPAVQSFEGERLSFDLPEAGTIRLNQLARREQTTLNVVLLSALNILLSRLAGQEDIVVGTITAGRPHADLEKVVGMFVGTIALRNFPGRSKRYTDFLREVRECLLRAYENQDYQFEMLVDKLGFSRDTGRNPLFDVLFVMQNIHMPGINVEGLEITYYNEFEHKTAKFDITVQAFEMDKKILIAFEYCTALFKKETVERMAEDYRKVLQSILANPDMKIEEIELAENTGKVNRVLTEDIGFEF